MRLRSAATLVALMDQWEISTRALAEASGMHHSAVDHLRAGRRTNVSAVAAYRIALALHTTVELLFYTGPPVSRVALIRATITMPSAPLDEKESEAS
ncbi:hypothetical protein [Rhodococcus koreensis]